MTEVPDYLLQRSQERRAALGLGGDEGAPATPAETEAEGGGKAPAAAAADAPEVKAPTPITPAAPAPEPAPPPANVVAARGRKRVPVWVLPALAALPIWAIVYAGTLEPPTEEDDGALAVGGEVYTGQCATCHGAAGGGGAAPALDVLGEDFGDPADQAHWVALGSDGWRAEVGEDFGDTGKPVEGGMPGWEDALTAEQLTAVVVYTRTQFSGLDPVEEGMVDEEGNLLVVWDAEAGELVPAEDAPAE